MASSASPAERLRALAAHVVHRDQPAERPGDEHRALQAERLADRAHVVGPLAGASIGLGRRRLARIAVAAQVHRDQPQPLGERALELPAPAGQRLPDAVQEQHGRGVPRAHVGDAQHDAIGRCDAGVP